MEGAQLDDKARRIVASAIELAEEGGFEAVRIRDIAAHADVALGTLYKRFSSKEDILIAALDREVGLLELLLERNPARGATPRERLDQFFRLMTQGLIAKTKLARAVLRATASGEPELKGKVESFHGRTKALIAAAIRGPAEGAERSALSDESVDELAFLLSQMWFSGLVGWMSGLFDAEQVLEQLRLASRWLFSDPG